MSSPKTLWAEKIAVSLSRNKSRSCHLWTASYVSRIAYAGLQMKVSPIIETEPVPAAERLGHCSIDIFLMGPLIICLLYRQKSTTK
jgi:hypothetical protein